MRKFFYKLAFYTFFFCAIFNIFGFFLDSVIRKSDLFKICIVHNSKIPENIILGGSRALTGISAEQLSNQTKTTWLNLAMDDTPVKLHKLFLDILINKKIKLKNIILEYYNTNKNNLSEDFYFVRKNEYQLLPFISEYSEIDDYFKNKRGYYLYKYFPIYKYVYFNTELFFPAIKLIISPKYRYKFNTYGDYQYPKYLKSASFNYDTKSIKLITINFNNKDLVNLKNECYKNKVKPYIITAPIYLSSSIQNFPINHYNFIEYDTLLSDFYDNIHINESGRHSLTDTISRFTFH